MVSPVACMQVDAVEQHSARLLGGRASGPQDEAESAGNIASGRLAEPYKVSKQQQQPGTRASGF